MTLEHEERGEVSQQESAGRRCRAAYRKPELVEFGDVRELTKGNNGSNTDHNGMPHV